jgi:cytochrome c-type biogenesis protein CcmH/NrfG
MFGLGKDTPLDRAALLRKAEELRGRNQPKKAIAELKKLLALDPNDVQAHSRLGPLLVLTGDPKQAVPSLRVAAADLDARGFMDKSLSVWLQVAQLEQVDVEAWEKVANAHVLRGRKADAVKALLQGAECQLGTAGRPRAVRLLRGALTIEPHHLESTLLLARVLKKQRAREEAAALLEAAVGWARGSALKRVRWTQWVLFPGFGTFWRWLRTSR